MQPLDPQYSMTLNGGDPLAIPAISMGKTESITGTLKQLLEAPAKDGLLVAGGMVNLFENVAETVRHRSIFNFMQSAVGVLGLQDDLQDLLGHAETLPAALSSATPGDIDQLLQRTENGDIDIESLTDGLKQMLASRPGMNPTNSPTPS